MVNKFDMPPKGKFENIHMSVKTKTCFIFQFCRTMSFIRGTAHQEKHPFSWPLTPAQSYFQDPNE